MIGSTSISEKLKEFLDRKLTESKVQIKKLKQKRKIIKILYNTSIILSVSTSVVIASLNSFIGVPITVITVLSVFSGILTGLSAKFNLENKKIEINKQIEKLNKLQAKLDYVVSCNGGLTQEEYKQIISEFNF